MKIKFGVLIAIAMVVFMVLFTGCVNSQPSDNVTQREPNVIKFLSKMGDSESSRVYDLIYEKYGTRVNSKVETFDIANGTPMEFKVLGYNETVSTYKPAAIVKGQLFMNFEGVSWQRMEEIHSS